VSAASATPKRTARFVPSLIQLKKLKSMIEISFRFFV
jgi:hypothetical protein